MVGEGVEGRLADPRFVGNGSNAACHGFTPSASESESMARGGKEADAEFLHNDWALSAFFT